MAPSRCTTLVAPAHPWVRRRARTRPLPQILLTDPALNPTANRVRTLEKMFERYSVGACPPTCRCGSGEHAQAVWMRGRQRRVRGAAGAHAGKRGGLRPTTG
eukprot:259810-Chlamydomonas_euryale.AAC.8